MPVVRCEATRIHSSLGKGIVEGSSCSGGAEDSDSAPPFLASGGNMLLITEAVEKAKAECKRFLGSKYHSERASLEAFAPLLKAVQLVLTATNLSAGLSRDSAAALEVISKHRDHDQVRQTVRVNIMPDGTIVKEDEVGCVNGCHTYAKRAYAVSLEELTEHGLAPREIAIGISRFLDDPESSLPGLSTTLMN